MTALAADRRDSEELDGVTDSYPVDAGQTIYQGAIVCIDSADGLAKPGATSTTLVAVGIATDQADNAAGADGDIEVPIRGNLPFAMKNSAGADEIETDDVGTICYIVDDQTVAKTNGGATRSPAGVTTRVDDSGSEGTVFVHIGAAVQPA